MAVVERLDLWETARPARLPSGATAGATALTVTAGGLSTWTPVVHGRFPVVVSRETAEEEHVYGSGIAGDQITGIEQIDGTPGLANVHAANATVEHGLFAEHIDQANAFLASPTAAGQVPVSAGAGNWGLSPGAVDGLTLTSAVLDAPDVDDFSNAGHDHEDAAGGGRLTQLATHEDPDTDDNLSSIHHTLGTGLFQAARGSHGHSYEWSDFTPTLTGAGGNPNLGATGFAVGRYAVLDRLVVAQVRITWAGAGVTGGTGLYSIALPPLIADTAGNAPLYAGSGLAFDASTGIWYPLGVLIATTMTVNLYPSGTAAASATTPFAWGGAGDSIHLALTYEHNA